MTCLLQSIFYLPKWSSLNIIIATDGSVTLGVGYHSWIVATEDEDIILQGGGPDDGDLFFMQPYRSELGGVAAGLAVLGTLSRSGLINITSTTFLLRQRICRIIDK
jgi:hypothetical protein